MDIVDALCALEYLSLDTIQQKYLFPILDELKMESVKDEFSQLAHLILESIKKVEAAGVSLKEANSIYSTQLNGGLAGNFPISFKKDWVDFEDNHEVWQELEAELWAKKLKEDLEFAKATWLGISKGKRLKIYNLLIDEFDSRHSHIERNQILYSIDQSGSFSKILKAIEPVKELKEYGRMLGFLYRKYFDYIKSAHDEDDVREILEIS